ncbi:MAG: phytanoyl-CoA dioxygenase family protein [Candidatus Poribacteria bacterium]|nr:phytanoyl-CoA dioxygenase family protein [Candidatus Poribacteria bacterium]
MNDDEKYLFDLNGYLVIEDVLTMEEIDISNQAIDKYANKMRIRPREEKLDGDSGMLAGTHGRGELGGLLELESPWCDPFRKMLVHPKIVPYLNEILGTGFRMDHQMFLISMDKGAEGFIFHGSSGPGFDPNQYYIFQNGKMHCGLTVVTFQLGDVNPGDGGLIVIPGSHKSNFSCPIQIKKHEKHQEHVHQIVCKAGSVVIFTEAVTHGTLPWTADHPRRSILTRYTAGNLAYVPAYAIPEWADERQRSVMEPPYHTRLNRPVLDQ